MIFPIFFCRCSGNLRWVCTLWQYFISSGWFISWELSREKKIRHTQPRGSIFILILDIADMFSIALRCSFCFFCFLDILGISDGLMRTGSMGPGSGLGESCERENRKGEGENRKGKRSSLTYSQIPPLFCVCVVYCLWT